MDHHDSAIPDDSSPVTSTKRWTNRKSVIVPFVACGVLFNLAILIPPVRHAGLALAGQGHGCTVAEAWQVFPRHRRLMRVKEELLAGQRLLTTENSLEQYQTPRGNFWTPKGSRLILPFNLAEQEIAIYGRAPQGVRVGDVVLDCGANVGAFARYSLEAGAARIIAIEPAPDNLECLRRNFAAEIAGGRVVIVPKGVWDKEDFMQLQIDEGNQAANTFVFERAGAKVAAKVPLTTIDKLVAELGLNRVDFIKMDIEGAEVRALQGSRQTISRHHPRMALAAYHLDTDPVEIPKVIRQAWSGYRIRCNSCVASGWHLGPDVLLAF